MTNPIYTNPDYTEAQRMSIEAARVLNMLLDKPLTAGELAQVAQAYAAQGQLMLWLALAGQITEHLASGGAS